MDASTLECLQLIMGAIFSKLDVSVLGKRRAVDDLDDRPAKRSFLEVSNANCCSSTISHSQNKNVNSSVLGKRVADDIIDDCFAKQMLSEVG